MDSFLQISKVAKVLDCSRQFVYQLIRDKKIDAINLNERALRISQSSIEDFIRSNKVNDLDRFPEEYKEGNKKV